MELFILFFLLATTYMMIVAKRMPSLVSNFRFQSFFLFLSTLMSAVREKSIELYVVSALLFVLKIIVIPRSLSRIGKKIKAGDNLGLLINAQLSLLFSLVLTYLSWIFSKSIISVSGTQALILSVSFSLVLQGMFLMIFRIKALAQIIGLLVMENGLFLLASSISGGMPFFVEIAIFFDVFVSVVILGVFVFRINKLFTHIDVNKLAHLRG